MSTIDKTGHDGPLSWKEVEAAAEQKFTALDTDRDDKLDSNELTGIMTHKQFVAADFDKDGVIDEAEFVAAAKKLFTAADIDGDGKLDKDDLSTTHGVTLVGLLAY